MGESTRTEEHVASTPHAGLAVIAMKLVERKLFDPIRQTVKIAQKTVLYSSADKLYHAFAGILSGMSGMVEINEGLRADPALQAAFGMKGCAEQSVIQETLDASTDDNVAEIHQAMDQIYQAHSRGFQHDYKEAYQVLDVDLTGQPCGRKAEFATKGYFAKQRNRRGRQVGRVLASRYHEIVVDRLYPGNVNLARTLPELVATAEVTLGIDQDEAKRRRTILRVDAGGGTIEDLNWALERGYRIHVKDYSSIRAEKLAESVTEWVDDPKCPGRQVGYVTAVPRDYVMPVVRVAVRCRKANGEWRVGVIVSALTAAEVLEEVAMPSNLREHPAAELLAYVYFYDGRGGGCETEFKGDKQGLGMTKRNKKRFAAQQVLGQLGALAHNVLIWSKAWLVPNAPVLGGFGIHRLVKYLVHLFGRLEWDAHGRLSRIVLNQASHLASQCLSAFQSLLAPLSVVVILGET